MPDGDHSVGTPAPLQCVGMCICQGFTITHHDKERRRQRDGERRRETKTERDKETEKERKTERER